MAKFESPLVVTGPVVAIGQALIELRSQFAATDVYEVATEGKTLKIADIRAARKLASQRAWSGRRLIIIRDAEKLSVAAANALLKTLEESGETTQFVLTTQWYRRLPPTIRSRCARRRVSGGQMEKAETAVELPASLLERLAAFAGEKPLDEATLATIRALLEQQLRDSGPTPALKTAYVRLKDYYLITSFPGGNRKLARDVLLASLPET